MKRNNLTLEVNFQAGTDLKDTIKEAQSLIKKLNIAGVSFSHNGHPLFVTKKTTAKEVVDEYLQNYGYL